VATIAALLAGLAGCGDPAGDAREPVVTLRLEPSRALVGEAVTIHWQVSDATTCHASAPSGGVSGWFGEIPAVAEGARVVRAEAEGLHDLRLECAGSQAMTQATASLEAVPVPMLPSRLEASVPEGFVGDPVTITWQFPWSAHCTAQGDWHGARPSAGSATIAIPRAGALEFGLRCEGGGRDTTATVEFFAVERRLDRVVTFTARPRTIPTSEGGPYGDTDFWTGETWDTWHDFGPTRVVRAYICLNGQVSVLECGTLPTANGPLPAAMLAEMEQRLLAFAGTGTRLLVRFTYNFGPIGADDAPLPVIATHLDQVMPILMRHRDLIFALEAGFLGTWGEWHNSTHGNDSETARRLVLDRERHHVAGAFPILVRLPGALLDYNGTASPNPELGMHNDYFASDAHDGGTYFPRDGRTDAELRAYAQAVASSGMFVAEFGALDPSRQECLMLEREMRRYHLQSLSLLIWPPEVGDALEAQGCLQHLLDRVGPRLELETLQVTGEARAGSPVELRLTIRNDGFGRVQRPRPARLLVLSQGAVAAEVSVPLAALDVREAAPESAGSGTEFTVPLTLPESLPTGDVTLALVFDDPAPSLRGVAAYALPLNSRDASGDLFDAATGQNRLARFTVLRR
jgi:hypothetical protein